MAPVKSWKDKIDKLEEDMNRFEEDLAKAVKEREKIAIHVPQK